MEKYQRDPNHYRHDSPYNNENDCENHGGKWVNFYNYLEKAPQHTNQASCTAAGYKWDYGYRSEEFDELKKSCFVQLEAPECKVAPYSRSNHLGNGDGITPLTYKWKLPHFPSNKEQRCFLRIRYVGLVCVGIQLSPVIKRSLIRI